MRTKAKGGRSAPRGSVVRRQLVKHTAQSEADLQELKQLWGQCTDVDVVRRSLRFTAQHATKSEKT